MKKITFLFAFLIISISLFAQKTVTGIVRNEEGAPLSGVNIQIKGTESGTVTDYQGKYRISVPNEKSRLVFSFVGYKTNTARAIFLPNMTEIDLSVLMVEDQQYLEDKIVVTATRNEQRIEDLPQKVEIINSKTIENTFSRDLADVLKKNAGVDIVQYPGMLSGIGIRGFRPQFGSLNMRSLTLIDGRPAGATNLAMIDMNNVERIEVLKGGASALYGSQAMGGVVNIITKKSTGEIKGKAFMGVGSYNSWESGISVGGNLSKKLDFDVSFNAFQQADDFKVGKGFFKDAFGAKEIKQKFPDGTSKMLADTAGDNSTRKFTSYNKYSGSFRLGYQFNDDWRIDAKVDRLFAKGVNAPSDIAYGNDFPSLKDVDRVSADVQIKGQIAENTSVFGTFYQAYEQSQNYNRTQTNWTTGVTTLINPYLSIDSKNSWSGLQLKAVHQIGEHQIIAGIDYANAKSESRNFNEKGKETAPYNPNFQMQNTGIYAVGMFSFLDNALTANIGLRYEYIKFDILTNELLNYQARNANNSTINPSLGIKYTQDSWNIHSTLGTGFTNNSIFNIAGYQARGVFGRPRNASVTQGNSDLKNQSSITWDLGVGYEKDNFKADITYFLTNFKNNALENSLPISGTQLTSSGDTIRSLTSYINAESSVLSGLEVNLSYQLDKIRLFANSVFIMKAKEISSLFGIGTKETDMYNVAKTTINYGAEWQASESFFTRLSGRYIGARSDRDFSWFPYSDLVELEYPPMMMLDWNASFTIKKQRISLMINNLTDENYYEKRGYNLAGRNFMVRYGMSF